MVGGEDPWPGSCCLLGQIPETVRHSRDPLPVFMQKPCQSTQPTAPDPLSQAWEEVGPWTGGGSGAGLRGQLRCIQGQSVVQELVLLCRLDHASSV